MKIGIDEIWQNSDKFTIGTVTSIVNFENVYNHTQSKIYYKSGIKELDIHFKENSNVKLGYSSALESTTNSINLYLIKYKGERQTDYVKIIFDRSKILFYEEEQVSNLEFVKKEPNKHLAKSFLRKATGAGIILSALTDNISFVNTEQNDGTVFKLYYTNLNGEKDFITLYTHEEYKNQCVLFLNTYYKNELSKEASQPIKDSNSSCYIATACYKDMFCKEVVFFRYYRDNHLLTNYIGKLFVKIYYSISPYLYNTVFSNSFFSSKIKKILDTIYNKLSSKH